MLHPSSVRHSIDRNRVLGSYRELQRGESIPQGTYKWREPFPLTQFHLNNGPYHSCHHPAVNSAY